MTDLSDTSFASHRPAHRISADVTLRPNVTEHFWGYEVRPNEQIFTIGTLLRVVSTIVSLAAAIATLGVWLVPQMAFTGEAFASKVILSVMLVCLAVFSARIAARSSRVRVQIDTANGELREVVDAPLSGPVVLARYGLDAVDAVEMVTSKSDPSFGQVQIKLNGLGTIAAGDGATTSLGPLLERLRRDCAVESAEKVRPAVWSGPLAA